MTTPEWQKRLEQLKSDPLKVEPAVEKIERFPVVVAKHDPFARRGLPYFKPPIDRPYKTTEGHDRLQAKFGVLSPWDLARLLRYTEVLTNENSFTPDHQTIKTLQPQRIVLEKPVVCDRYSRANDWRMDAVIEAEALHVIVEVKTTIDSMGELLGQCQRYMRHYRPDHLDDGEFCPVVVACPYIEPYIVEVLEAQGFYWLANERWEEFFGGVAS